MDFRTMGGIARDPNSGVALDTHEVNSLFKQYGAAGGDDDADTVRWDFGRQQAEAPQSERMFATAAPWASGAWDKKTTINLFALAKKIKHLGAPGTFLPAQWQPEGTCVGRGASGALNHLQFSRILGTPNEAIEWKPVSHAWMYAGALTQYNMLHTRSFGAVGAGAFQFGKAKGVAYQSEVNDTDYRSDKNAGDWGYSGIPAQYLGLGADNLIEDAAMVTDCDTLADLLAIGGVLTVASNQGFTMTRDSEGFCTARGSWAHQMFIGSVGVFGSRQRRGFGICQSWDQNVPGGPTAENHPDNVFLADWDTVARMLAARDSMGAWAFRGWNANLNWGAM